MENINWIRKIKEQNDWDEEESKRLNVIKCCVRRLQQSTLIRVHKIQNCTSVRVVKFIFDVEWGFKVLEQKDLPSLSQKQAKYRVF